MRKLLFMTNSLYGGGAEKILQTIISNINRDKYDITLYSLHREEVNHELYRGNLKYRSVFSNRSTLLFKIKSWVFNNCSAKIFYALFVRGRYDVEIAFIEGESTKLISGSLNSKSKKLAWVHIDLVNNPWTAFLYQNVKDESAHYQKFNKILCVSDSVKSAFIEKYGIESTKVRTQYNPIDRDAIRHKAESAKFLSPKTKIRMIAVGRLVEQKGFDRLLRIAYQLKEEGFKFEVYILGEGKMYMELKEYVITHNLQDIVFLLGFQDNPYAYMAESDLLVCSSRAEGFSTVVSEAVVLGVPVVSTDCAGVRELFGNKKCGIITQNTEESLYEALKYVLTFPDCLSGYRDAAIKRGEIFSLKQSMNELEKLFDE